MEWVVGGGSETKRRKFWILNFAKTLKFEGILKVKSKKITQKNKNKSLECLAIKCNKIINKNYEIIFLFSGNGIITLIAEFIEVMLHDLGEPWGTKHIPKHKIWMLIYLII